MGTTAGVRQLGKAPFVTFGRESGLAAGTRGATFIRIPWVPESASLDWLVRLELPLKGVIATRRVSWLEETFWGRRYLIRCPPSTAKKISLAESRLLPDGASPT